MFLGRNEIDLINSRFGSKQNAIRFYPADRCLLPYFPVNHFEVLSKREQVELRIEAQVSCSGSNPSASINSFDFHVTILAALPGG